MGVEKTCESERSQVLNMFWLQPVANLFNSTPVGHKHAQFLTSRLASSNDQDPGNFSLLLLQLDFLTRFSQATARSLPARSLKQVQAIMDQRANDNAA
ncbi:hypothetical protein [Agrobacterium sp. DE0009]|uniref:hypothetical protein n=1 Tax=Agrobacterium sp. DE0009 TaxID=2587505 RepID=UPI00119E090C|nr:hypothetical protein [Agrobacterium sp. DE0009]